MTLLFLFWSYDHFFVSPTLCLCTKCNNFSWVRRFFANIPTNFDLTKKKKLNNQTDANVQICKIALHNVSYSELQCNSNRAVNWRGLEPIVKVRWSRNVFMKSSIFQNTNEKFDRFLPWKFIQTRYVMHSPEWSCLVNKGCPTFG